MGIAIPQVITPSKASGAQVIDGSLTFDSTKSTHLTRTPSAAGNRKTWTWSAWVKRSEIGSIYPALLSAGSASGDTGFFQITFESDEFSAFMRHGSGTNYYYTNAKLRDTSSWYHLVVAMDTTQSAAADRLKIYINGVEQTFRNSSVPSQDQTFLVNNTSLHQIGATKNSSGTTNSFLPGHLSNVYLIDGQALDASYFGFTDPLTNTWKPKKYTGDFNILPDIGMGGDSGQAIEVVINRQVDKAWIKKYGSSTYEGGGDPSDPSSAPSFNLPSGGSLYWFTTAYDTAHTMVIGSSSETGTQPEWASGGTTGSLTRDSATTVSGTPSSSYSSARTDALADNTVYAFTFTITTGAGGAHTGWFLSTSSSYSTGTPDEQTSGNTVGARFGGGGTGYYNYVKVYGTFATLNPNSNGQLSNRGVNSFYLPMDGNSPIGKDQSENGNDFTPVNFGGSVALDNPQVSGARPILNTTQGGTQAGVGVFGSKQNVGYAVTVYNDGGGNKYYIDGVKQDTVTGLIRGATYTFDTSDSTVSSHPFRFSATSNGSHGGGSEYTNGVAAITGAATTITVPHDAPNTLYYYCTSHSGMGADITGITTNEKLADQYASNCTLALPLVGANSDVCASIACTMTNKAVTSNGDAAASNKQSNFYSGSFEFDGTDDHLNITSQSDVAVGTGDFTLEFWAYFNSANTDLDTIMETRSSTSASDGFLIGRFQTSGHENKIELYTASDYRVTADVTTQNNSWVHVATVRSSSVTKLYINGKAQSTTYSDTNNYSNDDLIIGENVSSSHQLDGYVQDFRIYKGVAKYTSDFVVPSRSPDILPDTPSGVSGGSKFTKITDGAVHFDDNGYLFAGSSSDYNFGTGDFTIEGYFYFDNSTTTPNDGLWQISGTSGGLQAANSTLSCNYETSGGKTRQLFMGSAGGWRQSGSDNEFLPFMWNHVAEVRSSGTISVYINGKLSQSWSDTTNYTFTDCVVGAYYSTSYRWNGYISNFRVVNGTAVYTKDFTPPTRELTNVTNTKLLCCQSNTSAVDTAVVPGTAPNTRNWSARSNWNSGGTLTNASSYPLTAAFDGNLNTTFAMSYAGGMIWTAPSTISFSSSIEVYVNSSIGTGGQGFIATISGVQQSKVDLNAAGSWETVYSGSGTFDKLEMTRNDGGNNNNLWISAIRVDGTVLVDAIAAYGDAAATATNFNSFNTDINTVRGQETGYATFNPLRYSGYTTSDRIFTDGNLRMLGRGDGVSNFGATTGKFYAEVFVERIKSGESGQGYIGVIAEPETYSERGWPTSKIAALRDSGGGASNNFYGDGKGTTTTTWTEGDTISVAFDADAAKVWIAKNGRYINGGNPATGATASFSGLTFKDYYLLVSDNKPTSSQTTDGNRYQINFGQKPFKYVPPDGFQPLTTANTRPVNVISRPDQYVGVTTYTGSAPTAQQITGLNFGTNPDFVWIKNYSDATGYHHGLFDTVRGPNKVLASSATAVEATTTQQLMSFDLNGFTVGTNSDSQNYVNLDADGYVAWCWKAGGNKNTFNVDDVGYASAAAAGLDGGSLSVTGASVGTKQGFSIIKFTGTGVAGSVSHGLTQKPDFIIAKNIDGTANDWPVHHSSLTDGTYTLYLNGTATASAATAIWPSASTDSVINVGSGAVINESAKSTILYSWHNVPGLQKFGSYEGNANDNGPYVELGFRPSILWVKNIDASGNWVVHDNQRNKFNPAGKVLKPDTADQEDSSTSNYVDFLSNGFKIRNSQSKWNGSYTYIYCAWAEAPSIDLFGGGANAR